MSNFTKLPYVELFYLVCDLIRVHLVLAKLDIVHFLCLGGLWGQVRIGRALPWARKVELCMVDTLRDDVLITKAFREVGLSATYLHAAGVYRIQEHEVGEDAPKVEIVVFEEDAVVSLILLGRFYYRNRDRIFRKKLPYYLTFVFRKLFDLYN